MQIENWKDKDENHSIPGNRKAIPQTNCYHVFRNSIHQELR